MAGWEIALVIMAVTFMVVNVVSIIMQVALLADFKDIMKKSCKIMSKMLDKSDKMIDQMFEDLED